MFSGRVSAARLIGKITAPADLVAELVVAVSTRNTLAHEYLLLYRLRALHEGGPHRRAVAELRRITKKFEAVTDRLNLLSADLGIEPGAGESLSPLSPHEARKIWLEATDAQRRALQPVVAFPDPASPAWWAFLTR